MDRLSNEQIKELLSQIQNSIDGQSDSQDSEIIEAIDKLHHICHKGQQADISKRQLEVIDKLLKSSHIPLEPQLAEQSELFAQVYHHIVKLRIYVMALAKGELHYKLDASGYLAGALKSLQANLRHLSWQTQQVADGDFSQRVDFMGEFANSFNKMIIQLDEMTHKLRLQNEALQQEIRHRELIEIDLTKALRNVQEANNDLQSFTYVVSHDLKAPLRGIAAIATWLQQDYEAILDDDGRESLSLLVDRSKKLTTMVDGILQYSRMGSMADHTQLINLHELVEQTYKMLNPPASTQFIITCELPQIKADPIRISQLFQNLLSNAIRYTSKPDGCIEIGLRRNGELTFTVSDNGPGIEESEKQDVFQLFNTGSHPSSDSTGIGLAVVKRVCEYYEGRVWVESSPSNGACFCFTLPLTAT